jgi:8-oxo-dGTP pyrophosphatase MutT (NUDIX family)
MDARNKLLKKFITEVLAGLNSNPSFNAGGNGLYTTGRDDADSNVRPGASKNVNADFEDDEAETIQSEHQAACCLIIKDDGSGKILAVSRRDDASQMGFPGGKVDAGGETAKQAAARELIEETGLTASSLSLVFSDIDGQGFVTSTFACKVSGHIHTDEEGVIKWVDPSVLMDPTTSPFSEYNTKLFNHLGLA